MANTRTEKKQADILKVATKLFLERGYDAVSLDDILERVGGSQTTQYRITGAKKDYSRDGSTNVPRQAGSFARPGRGASGSESGVARNRQALPVDAL